jgi:uncharacterized protein (TIGR03435 family)
MHRAPFLVWLTFGLIVSPAIAGAQSNASRPHPQAVSEDHAALPYQVHIAPTSQPDGSSSIETGGDSWAARGYDLRTLIAQIFNVDTRRIDFPDEAMAAHRFDITVSLPVEVDDSTMQRLLAEAVQKRFGLRIAPESRPMDVYVLTAPNGPSAAMKRHVAKMTAAELTGFAGTDSPDEFGKVTVFGQDCTDKGSSAGISVEASTMSDFRRTLEPDLDRVLLDETHLAGSFDFTVGNYTSEQQLFELLHDQLGLVVTPAERNVTVLAVRPAGAQSTQTMQARL